jgi:GDP-L-fucose synthase
MHYNSKIYVAGHNGMVGSSLIRKLKEKGYNNIITARSSELDLRNLCAVESFFEKQKPDYVFLAAALVGGIQANIDKPTQFLLDNLRIQNNVIEVAYKNGVERLLFLGSSCIYPKESLQPIKEEYLLTGELEPTNEGYAIAKIAGLKYIEYLNRQFGAKYISVMPCNIYGVNDNFDSLNSHVLAASIKRIDKAIDNNLNEITIWGDGESRREFMYVDDLADALVFLMNNYFENKHINVGTGSDISILELNKMIAKIMGFKGKVNLDLNKPNGMRRKLLDVSKLNSLGWKHKIELEEGIKKTIKWYSEKIK